MMSDPVHAFYPEESAAAAVITLNYDHSINYAFQQNAIPIIKELHLKNGPVPRRDLTLRVTVEPAFAAPAEIRLQAIEADGEFRQAPLALKLSHDFLAGLNEKVAGWLKVELLEGDEERVAHSVIEPVSLLARNEWCGLAALPEILAAFVLPNDPAVMTVLGRASEILHESTGRSQLNGYQDKNRKHAWEQLAAIHKAIAGLGIRYINPPASFESTGQKVRFPSEILSRRFGTCLDLALLFAACCEQAGLRPLVLIHEGHAYGGCWLEERALTEPASEDLQHLRKLEADELITVFEAVSVTWDTPGNLNTAELSARPYLKTALPFRLALDVRRAREGKTRDAGIHPLPIPGQENPDDGTGRNPAHARAAGPGIGTREFTDQLQPAAAPAARPGGRIDLWKSRLLDLSLRNRLLNFRATKSTLLILSAEPEKVEDELAGQRELALLARPRMMAPDDPRNPAAHALPEPDSALTEHLRAELAQGRLHTSLEDPDHARRLTELYRAARNSLDENGTNTLFAAVGILEWKETEFSDRVHQAPLLLVPVELRRKSVLEGFSLRRLDEETRLNVTLMEMLRQNFRKDIPGLDPLPEDENGVHVTRVLQIFRDAVRDLAGWEVKSEIWLGQFSFTKFLLWKDLTDRLEDLAGNRIVRHLIHEAGTPYANPPGDIRPQELDDRFHPREILCPRSADSSQLAAVMAAAAGHDFILEGPPGTGKSQTITNIIAHCLSQGKRVLFVAEKRAALDVVHRRLREDGLEPFCLELHSNKSGKADVLTQFDRSLKLAPDTDRTGWDQRTAELERLRSSLNAYTRALHRRYPCGLSAHACLDHLLPRRDGPAVRLPDWPSLLETPAETLHHARQLACQLRDRFRSLPPPESNPLALLSWEEWSQSWSERTLDRIGDLKTKALAVQAAADGLASWLRYPGPRSRTALNHLLRLAESLLSPEPAGAAFITSPWPQLAAALDRWTAQVRERAALRAALLPVHAPRAPETVSLPAERWSPQEAETLFRQARELEILSQEASEASAALRQWLDAPASAAAARGELAHLSALAETLLTPLPVGPEFAAADWSARASDLEQWAVWVRDRAALRAGIAGYDEKTLLDLDLDLLREKWEAARTGWFLPKWLNTRFVLGRLHNAQTTLSRPGPAAIGELLTTALKLRAIRDGIAAARRQAEALLGATWNGGEPDARALAEVRQWGKTLLDRLTLTAGGDAAWLRRMRGILAEILPLGPAGCGPETAIGRLFARHRSAFARFDQALSALLPAASLTPPSAGETAGGYFGSIREMLTRFLDSAPRLREMNEALAGDDSAARACLGPVWRNGEPRAEEIARTRAWGETLHTRLQACGTDDPAWSGEPRRILAALFHEGPAAWAPGTGPGEWLGSFRSSWLDLTAALDSLAVDVRLQRKELNAASDHPAAIIALADGLIRAWPRVREWCLWRKSRQEAAALGLSPLVDLMESPGGSATDVPALFETSFRRAFLAAVIDSEPVLRDFLGSEHSGRIERFRALDDRLATLSRDLIHARLSDRIPRDQGLEEIPKTEIGLLRKEIAKRSRHIPVRQLLNRIPTLLPRLKPCVLMSPLSVAQYLEPSHQNFDVVIFDEASQIPVWDAIGAIARGSQLIVVGDPKQLPPTSFFSGGGSGDEDDGTPEEHRDLESILDELMTNGLRQKRLKWHYRSRHEGLITFSNRQYYNNDLLTFPGPDTVQGGVRFRHLPEARYDKGKSRTNRGEAEALVRELSARLRDPAASRRSFGVVTFSQAQQQLVENLLDEERRQYPEIEVHFGDSPPVEGEPIFVKNLENVQGDERDVILFSICYGPDESGRVSMNFGPLNRDGGERRLNVAITRAKHEMVIFSGLRGDQIDLTRSRARGVQDLKHFLEYAERGPRALTSATLADAGAEPDSEFEKMVADRLRREGYEVHHQVGCSGYRLDLGIVDPAAPGRYLLGVECDGATYHRAATARDRDKLRQLILEGLGWTLHRIWSTDWWHDADREMDKLLQAIRRRLAATGGAPPAA